MEIQIVSTRALELGITPGTVGYHKQSSWVRVPLLKMTLFLGLGYLDKHRFLAHYSCYFSIFSRWWSHGAALSLFALIAAGSTLSKHAQGATTISLIGVCRYNRSFQLFWSRDRSFGDSLQTGFQKPA